MTHYRSVFAILLTLSMFAACGGVASEPMHCASDAECAGPTLECSQWKCTTETGVDSRSGVPGCFPIPLADGATCDNGSPENVGHCSAGTCVIAACNAGWSQCPGDIGCMTHTDADANNCGACSNVCSYPHASTQCFAGKCWMGACDAGWGSCYDVPPTNGCETYLDGDPKNCGACGNVCATGTCQSGTCVTGS